MRLYHRTAAGEAILAEGFRNGRGHYLTSNVYEGVWLSNIPLDVNEGASGDDLLVVEIPRKSSPSSSGSTSRAPGTASGSSLPRSSTAFRSSGTPRTNQTTARTSLRRYCADADLPTRAGTSALTGNVCPYSAQGSPDWLGSKGDYWAVSPVRCPEPPSRIIRQFRLIEIAIIGLMSRQTGVILAEVGFLLILFAGVWLVAAQIPAFKMPTRRTIVAGIALALGGLLLIIATHWGHFGRPS